MNQTLLRRDRRQLRDDTAIQIRRSGGRLKWLGIDATYDVSLADAYGALGVWGRLAWAQSIALWHEA